MSEIRKYSVSDKEKCIQVFDSNLELFFDVSERKHFLEFLDQPNCEYLVLLDTGQVVGCGGFHISHDRVGRLCWGMIDKIHHKNGFGRELSAYRIDVMVKSGVKKVLMNTSKHSLGFYEKLGFTVTKIIKDGFSKGLDQYDLELIIVEA
ncbi:MAG: GNAT family N-acetyltransferase [Bdellovibrionales bacterium]|nr:GNAT family N-acetyltransferase [Bdellovibrionales bacterium]NQZ18238.1 GNAT family N-acetyltransferase [Bdellovibrionales bacterium]